MSRFGATELLVDWTEVADETQKIQQVPDPLIEALNASMKVSGVVIMNALLQISWLEKYISLKAARTRSLLNEAVDNAIRNARVNEHIQLAIRTVTQRESRCYSCFLKPLIESPIELGEIPCRISSCETKPNFHCGRTRDNFNVVPFGLVRPRQVSRSPSKALSEYCAARS